MISPLRSRALPLAAFGKIQNAPRDARTDKRPTLLGPGPRALLALAALLLCGFEPFRSQSDEVAQGNRQMAQGKPKEALKAYDQARKALPDAPGVHYNRGIALYKLGKFDEARQALLKGTAAADRRLKTRAFYNLGNAMFKLERYPDAVDAYRRALRLDPKNQSAKWNLELALKRIEEKKKKKDEEEKKKKDEEEKKKKDEEEKKKQDQQKQDQQKQDQQKQDQQKQDQQKQDQQDRQQQQKPRPPPDQQQRDRVLDALDRSDKNLQRQRLRMLYGGRRRPPERDW